MDDAKLERRLTTHLQQAHAMERSLVSDLRTLSSEMELASVRALLDRTIEATKHQAAQLEQRLGELGSHASLRLLTQASVAALPKLVADRLRPPSACAVLRDAILAQATQIAAYLLLEAEAIRGGDESTAAMAHEFRLEECDVRDELLTFWNQAVDHDIDARAEDVTMLSRTRTARAMLLDHLRDVHALERNAVMMLSTVLATVHDELAKDRVEDHRSASVRHGDVILDRLHELDERASLRKVAQGAAFAVVKGPFNLVRAERAAKDLRDMYVVEHMELVAYAQLEVLADRAGDERTQAIAIAHAEEEQHMATWLEHDAARFLLESLGLTVR